MLGQWANKSKVLATSETTTCPMWQFVGNESHVQTIKRSSALWFVPDFPPILAWPLILTQFSGFERMAPCGKIWAINSRNEHFQGLIHLTIFKTTSHTHNLTQINKLVYGLSLSKQARTPGSNLFQLFFDAWPWTYCCFAFCSDHDLESAPLHINKQLFFSKNTPGFRALKWRPLFCPIINCQILSCGFLKIIFAVWTLANFLWSLWRSCAKRVNHLSCLLLFIIYSDIVAPESRSYLALSRFWRPPLLTHAFKSPTTMFKSSGRFAAQLNLHNSASLPYKQNSWLRTQRVLLHSIDV